MALCPAEYNQTLKGQHLWELNKTMHTHLLRCFRKARITLMHLHESKFCTAWETWAHIQQLCSPQRLQQQTQLWELAVRTAAKCSDWTKPDSSYSSFAQYLCIPGAYTREVLIALHWRSINSIYSQNPFTFCNMFTWQTSAVQCTFDAYKTQGQTGVKGP